MVIEPTFPSNLKNVFNMIMEKIYDNLPVGQQAESSHDVINRVLIEVLEELGLRNDDPSLLPKLLYYILREVEGYGKIDPLMRDPNVEEISVLGANEPVIVVHKLNTQTRWLKTNIVFERDELDRFIIKLAQKCGSSISAAFPIKELRTPEGHRIILFYGHEVTGKGSSFIIRKFPSSPISIIQLIDWDMLSSLEAAYLWLLLEHKKPIVIVGEMASGKTTLLSSLITLIPRARRILLMGAPIETPYDFAIDRNGKRLEVPATKVNGMIKDIGDETINMYHEMMKDAKVIVLRGPAGIIEEPLFRKGTFELAKRALETDAFTIFGGGHFTAIANELDTSLKKKIGHISLAGGALLLFLSGETLPALTALEKSAKKFIWGET